MLISFKYYLVLAKLLGRYARLTFDLCYKEEMMFF